MKHRRFLALVASASLLHLTVVAGDAACATHGAMEHGGSAAAAVAGGQAGVHPASHAGMHAGARHDLAGAQPAAAGAGHAASEAPPCETPVQQRCCETRAGCRVAGVVAGARVSDASSSPPVTRVDETLLDAPPSFVSPPEPPPPRR